MLKKPGNYVQVNIRVQNKGNTSLVLYAEVIHNNPGYMLPDTSDQRTVSPGQSDTLVAVTQLPADCSSGWYDTSVNLVDAETSSTLDSEYKPGTFQVEAAPPAAERAAEITSIQVL